MIQCRTQLEREFAEKAERWCKNVSDKLHILKEHSVDGIIQIESALRMEVAKMEERTRCAQESSISYEEAGKLIITEEDADDKIIFQKFETSFQEMLNPYKRFCTRVEKEHKVYKRSMVRLEKLYMDENASWFSKKKVKKARKVAKRNSESYIKLLTEETNQAINVNSLSVEYEGVATEIANNRDKSFVKCWSTCMSQHAESSKAYTHAHTLQYDVDCFHDLFQVKLLSEFNKKSLQIPTYQEFHGTIDIEELLGYRPVVETIISEDKVREANKVENQPMTPADSYDRLYNPFCLEADEHGDEKNELVSDGLLAPADSYDKLHSPFCSNADKHEEEKNELVADNLLTPADSYDKLYNPVCSNGNENGEDREELERNKPITPADSYDKLFYPFCSNEDAIKEGNEEGDKFLTPVAKCDERKLNQCRKTKVIHEHKRTKCLEMDIKP
ncbi:hypothetical protein ACJMK2_023999, partial [Sinanodonta woodiana]